MNRYRLVLSDPVDAVVALLFDGGVPPTGNVDDVRRRRQRQARAGSTSAEDQDVEGARAEMLLEAIHRRLALADGRIAVDQVDVAQAEPSLRQLYEAILHGPMLDEDERPFLACADAVEDVECRTQPSGRGDEVGILAKVGDWNCSLQEHAVLNVLWMEHLSQKMLVILHDSG